MLDSYKMIVVAFSVTKKTNQIRFIEKTFLMVNVSPKVVFEMSFLILSNVNIDLLNSKL